MAARRCLYPHASPSPWAPLPLAGSLSGSPSPARACSPLTPAPSARRHSWAGPWQSLVVIGGECLTHYIPGMEVRREWVLPQMAIPSLTSSSAPCKYPRWCANRIIKARQGPWLESSIYPPRSRVWALEDGESEGQKGPLLYQSNRK